MLSENSPTKMKFRALQTDVTPWSLETMGVLGLTPQNEFINYLIPLLNTNVSLTFKYDLQEPKDKEEK